MKVLKLTIIGSVLFISSLTALSAQASSRTISNEGRLNGVKLVKKEVSPVRVLPQNQETIIQMEKQEKELIDMSTAVDGRSSKEETTIINHSKKIRETISK